MLVPQVGVGVLKPICTREGADYARGSYLNLYCKLSRHLRGKDTQAPMNSQPFCLYSSIDETSFFQWLCGASWFRSEDV